jgi:hypothetical protein
VPVGVVRTDRDERHPGSGGLEEGRVGVGAAVVRDLEDVGAQVDPAGEDPALGRRAQVPGEQHPHTALGDPHDQRQVVGRRSSGGDLRRWREDLQLRGPDDPPVPRPQHLAPGAGPVGGRVQPGRPLVGR